MMLHHPLSNPFCTCENEKHEIFPETDDHNDIERYKYERAALCPSMRNLFPTARPEERIELLKIFAPDPRFGNPGIMTGMFDPPSLDEFLASLRIHGLSLEVGWKKRPVSPGTVDSGNLSNKEKFVAKVSLVSHLAKEVSLLINDRTELSGSDLDMLIREMAELLQNDVIQLKYSETNSARLFYDFKKKGFEKTDGMWDQNLDYRLFRNAYVFLRSKGERLPIMSRRVVFADKVLA